MHAFSNFVYTSTDYKMENNLLEQILSSQFGSFGFVFAFILGGFWFVIWVSFRVAKIQALHSAFMETIKDMKSNMKDNISDVKSDIKDIQRNLVYVSGAIDILKSHGTKQSPVEAHSPLAPQS